MKCHTFQFYKTGLCVMNHYANSDARTEYRHQYVKSEGVNIVQHSFLKALFPNSDGTLDTIDMTDLSTEFLPIAPNRTLTGAKLRNIASKAHHFVSTDQRNYYPVTDDILPLEVHESGVSTATVPKNKKPKIGKLFITKPANGKITKTVNATPESSLKGQQSLLSFITKRTGVQPISTFMSSTMLKLRSNSKQLPYINEDTTTATVPVIIDLVQVSNAIVNYDSQDVENDFAATIKDEIKNVFETPQAIDSTDSTIEDEVNNVFDTPQAIDNIASTLEHEDNNVFDTPQAIDNIACTLEHEVNNVFETPQAFDNSASTINKEFHDIFEGQQASYNTSVIQFSVNTRNDNIDCEMIELLPENQFAWASIKFTFSAKMM